MALALMKKVGVPETPLRVGRMSDLRRTRDGSTGYPERFK